MRCLRSLLLCVGAVFAAFFATVQFPKALDYIHNPPDGPCGHIAIELLQPARSHYSRGVCFGGLTQPTRAIGLAHAVGSFTHAVKLEPEFALAWRARGSAYYALKRYSQAVADYTVASRLMPHDFSTAYGHALALMQTKRTSAALDRAEKALAITPYDESTKNLVAYLRTTLAIGVSSEYVSATPKPTRRSQRAEAQRELKSGP